MAGKLGKFQMVGPHAWMGLTKESHLGSIYGLKPQRATDIMVQLLALHRGKTLDTYLSQLPTKEFDTDDEYTWDVIGTSRRNIPLVEARTSSNAAITSETVLGANTEPFYLVFPEDWFPDGVVIGGNKNEAYPLRVLGDSVQEGTNYRVKVELMGGITSGMPVSELTAGTRFSIEYAPIEKELSRGVGDIHFSTPMQMRNEWSRIRLKHKVPGSMLNQKVAVGIPIVKEDASGKMTHTTTDMWMHNVEWQFEQEWSDYKNNIIMYGRSNRNSNGEYMNFGKSGSVIKIGEGLRAQMEAGNQIFYNTFSLELLENVLTELSTSKLGFNDRFFIIRTGERGAMQFHKAVLNEVSGWTQFQLDNNSTKVIQHTSSKLHSNALSAGFQFVEYMAPNGIRIKVEVDPFYDDVVRNKIIHPNGKSYTFQQYNTAA